MRTRVERDNRGSTARELAEPERSIWAYIAHARCASAAFRIDGSATRLLELLRVNDPGALLTQPEHGDRGGSPTMPHDRATMGRVVMRCLRQLSAFLVRPVRSTRRGVSRRAAHSRPSIAAGQS